MPDHKNTKKRNARSGFTLIEVMIVLFIMMTIAAAGILAYGRIQQNANIKIAKVHLSQFKDGLALFNTDMNRYPTTDEGLRSLIECPPSANPDKYGGPYLDQLILDPWDQEYGYESDGFHYRIWSPGPPGTGSEIEFTK